MTKRGEVRGGGVKLLQDVFDGKIRKSFQQERLTVNLEGTVRVRQFCFIDVTVPSVKPKFQFGKQSSRFLFLCQKIIIFVLIRAKTIKNL